MASFKAQRKAERAAEATKRVSEVNRELQEKRDEENKSIQDQQDEYDKQFNTQKHRASTSDAGGRFTDKSGNTVRTLSKDEAVKLGIKRAQETNQLIRKYDNLTELEKQNLRNRYGEAREPYNESIGGRSDVYYRNINDQARVREKYLSSISAIKKPKDSTSQIIPHSSEVDSTPSRITGIYQGDRFYFGAHKSREISAREKAELISSGDYSNSFVGDKSNEVQTQEQDSFEQQNFRKNSKYPITYTDKSGKEIFSITGQSKGSKFDYFENNTKKNNTINNFLNIGSNAKRPDTREIMPTIPLEAKPQGKVPDPLGISSGIQSILDTSESKSLQSKKILDSDANFIQKDAATKTQVVSEAGKYFVGIAGDLINLGGQIHGYQIGKESEKQVNVPPTFESLVIEKTIQNPTNIGGNLKQSYNEYSAKYGTVGVIGSGAASALTLIPLVSPIKALTPLKVATLPITRKGVTQTARVLVATVGERTKPLITQAGGKVSRGFDVEQINFKAIGESYNAKQKGGAELAHLGRTEEKIISSEKNLQTFERSGQLSSDSTNLIRAGKTIVQESKRVPNKPFRKDFTEQPFENIAKGSETQAIKDFFRAEKITLEGSAIDIPTFLPKYAGRAGDFDVKVSNYAKAQSLAQSATNKLNLAATQGRTFEREGGKIILYQRGKKIGKAGEFLSHNDPESAGQLSKTNKVFGVTSSQKKQKIEGIKTKTLQFQINRRVASITSIQPTKTGAKINPPINPVGQGSSRAKDFPRAYAGAKTSASLFAQAGQLEKAEKISKAADVVKQIGSKEINFNEFYKSKQFGTLSLEQQQKASRNLASVLPSASKSPVITKSSSITQSFGNYPQRQSSINYKESNLSSPRSVLSKSSGVKYPSSKSTGSVLSGKSGASVYSGLGKSSRGYYSSKSIGSVSSFGSKPSKSSYGLSSPKSSTSLFSGGGKSSLLSTSSKSSASIISSKQPTYLPKVTSVLPLLKFSQQKKRRYKGRQGATQTRIFGVKNPFSNAFSIKGKRGGKIEGF